MNRVLLFVWYSYFMSTEIKPFDWEKEPVSIALPEVTDRGSEVMDQTVEVDHEGEPQYEISSDKISLISASLGGIAYLGLRVLGEFSQLVSAGGGLVVTFGSLALILRVFDKQGTDGQ